MTRGARAQGRMSVPNTAHDVDGLDGKMIATRAQCSSSGAYIPKQVFMTYPSNEDPQRIRDVTENLVQIGRIEQASLHFFNDEQMAASACEISQLLDLAGVPRAYDAFIKLRPPAFKADLWRYMVLWRYGGVYVDFELRANSSLDSWLPFDSENLVLVKDKPHKLEGYWNAVMASPEGSELLLHVIRHVVENVLTESQHYGLAITGPRALFKAVQSSNCVTTVVGDMQKQDQGLGQELIVKGHMVMYSDEITHRGLKKPGKAYHSVQERTCVLH